MTHRECPDRRPITGKVASLGLTASLAHRPGKTDRANRLIDRSPGRPGNAGNRQRPVSPAVHQGSLRHGPGRRLRYRALARQGCFRNTQHVNFCSIGIGHEATIEPGRTAGNRRQRLRYPATGTGFCSSQHFTAVDRVADQPVQPVFPVPRSWSILTCTPSARRQPRDVIAPHCKIPNGNNPLHKATKGRQTLRRVKSGSRSCALNPSSRNSPFRDSYTPRPAGFFLLAVTSSL